MHPRLLSFLSDIENALLADDPAPAEGGAWIGTRTVNYHLGLARLTLAVRRPAGDLEDRGTVRIQSYALADGTSCLKAALDWAGREDSRICPVYTKPGIDWRREARKVAADWMAGPAPLAVPVEVGQDLATATG